MRKKYLALSPRFLSRLSYHPIWGLGHDRKGRKNFYELVQDLDSDENLLRSIELKTNSILQRSGFIGFMIRSFNWLFNRNQYCHNYYMLQAYYSWQKYKEGISMFSDSEVKDIDESGGFILEQEDTKQLNKDSALDRVGPIIWFIATPLIWCIGGISSCLSQETIKEISKPKDEYFNVDIVSQEQLKILGIEAQLDSQFSISELKKHYRKLYLKYHPDKQGGNADKFQEIKGACEKLLSHISPNKDIFGLDERIVEFRAQAKMDHELADIAIKRAQEVNDKSARFLEEFYKRDEARERKFQQDLSALEAGTYISDSDSDEERYSPTMFHKRNTINSDAIDTPDCKDDGQKNSVASNGWWVIS